MSARPEGYRVFCRNLRCRTKLPAPVDNPHRAFCTPYCYDQFYYWKCRVCEKPILKGRRLKQPEHCHSVKCRKTFRTYPEAFGYPSSQSVNLDSRSAHLPRAFLGLRAIAGWHWNDSKVEGEHWLYAYDTVVAIIAGAEGDWRVRYPETFPVQAAKTLEAARELAIHVAFWTWPIGGLKPKPAPKEKVTEAEWRARDAADAQYVAEDEERLRTAPVDLSGNYAPAHDLTDHAWIDWPPDEGAP